MNNKIINKSKNNKNLITGESNNKISYIRQLLNNEFILILCIISFICLLGFIVIMFENGIPHVRTSFVNNFMGFGLAIFCIYLIFFISSQKIDVFGVSFDISLIYYLILIGLLMILFVR